MASAALIAELDAYATEFSQRADRGGYLDRAARRVSSERYGTVYTDAVVLVAAHMLSSGTVNYATPGKGTGAYYGSTDHGLSFLELRSLVRPGPVLLDDNQAQGSTPRT
jgi:hypothetical protein